MTKWVNTRPGRTITTVPNASVSFVTHSEAFRTILGIGCADGIFKK